MITASTHAAGSSRNEATVAKARANTAEAQVKMANGEKQALAISLTETQAKLKDVESKQLGDRVKLAIEGAIDKSSARSDEQLAYYVAQAREVIDLSIASQQGLVDHLRQLQGRPAPAPALAALADGTA